MTTIENAVRNGVDTATLFATLDAVKGDTDLAKFQFRATNRWLSGTHNQSTIHGYRGAKQEMTHRQPFTFDADHPPVLVGSDNGPTPVEYLLHALAACLTAGIANVAAARSITLPRSPRPSRATSTCWASSGCRTRSATATSRSRSASRSAVTTRRSCAPSSSSRAAGRPCSTSSPTVCPCRSTSTPADHTPRPPGSPARPGGRRATFRSPRCAPPTPSSSAPARQAWLPAAASPTRVTTTWCSTAAGSDNAGAAARGTPCTC
jgi:hypothetical protein